MHLALPFYHISAPTGSPFLHPNIYKKAIYGKLKLYVTQNQTLPVATGYIILINKRIWIKIHTTQYISPVHEPYRQIKRKRNREILDRQMGIGNNINTAILDSIEK